MRQVGTLAASVNLERGFSNMITVGHSIPTLPLQQELESRAVLKAVAAAHRRLAELKGVARSIPNETILISTLALQEAKDSSAIENIITTHDELFRAELFIDQLTSPTLKKCRTMPSHCARV